MSNSSAVQDNITSNDNSQDELIYNPTAVEQVIRTFANRLNDTIYKLKKINCDTTELMKMQDILRYSILQDESINKICSHAISWQSFKRIQTYNALLNDLIKQLDEIYEKNAANDVIIVTESTNRSVEEKLYPKYSKKKPNLSGTYITLKGMIGHAFFMILTTGIVISSSLWPKEHFEELKNSPPIEGHKYYSTLGDEEKSGQFNDAFEEISRTAVIREYSAADAAGNRTVKTYKIDGDAGVLSIKSLNNLDLTKYTPISVEQVTSDISTPSIAFRTCDIQIVSQFGNHILAGDIVDAIFISVIFTAILKFCHFLVVDETLDDAIYELFKTFSYNTFVALPQHLSRIRSHTKKLSSAKEEERKLKVLANITCQRIEKTIIACAEELSRIESVKKERTIAGATNKEESNTPKRETVTIAQATENRKIVEQAQKKEAEYKEREAEQQKIRQQKMQEIKKILSTLSSALAKFDEHSENTGLENETFHTIEISEDTLLEVSGDHLKIRDIFLPVLKFLDLSMINFDNVDIRGVDFRKTNAKVFLRRVYHMDASGAKFDNENLPDWQNYDKVNISGAVLDEEPSTMVSLKTASADQNTVIGKKTSPSTGSGHGSSPGAGFSRA